MLVELPTNSASPRRRNQFKRLLNLRQFSCPRGSRSPANRYEMLRVRRIYDLQFALCTLQFSVLDGHAANDRADEQGYHVQDRENEGAHSRDRREEASDNGYATQEPSKQDRE